MLFILHFRTNQLTLPLNYHAKVQGLLYKLIQGFPDYSDFLHDTGYSDGRKQFKLFCFSDLTGPHHLRSKTIIFPQRFSFQLRTADPILGELLYQALMQEQSYQLGNQQIWLERVETTQFTVGCPSSEAPHGLAHHGVCVPAGRKDSLLQSAGFGILSWCQ